MTNLNFFLYVWNRDVEHLDPIPYGDWWRWVHGEEASPAGGLTHRALNPS